MKRLTTEGFIEKAKNVHGDRYGYSKTEYVNARTKVCIICPEHGEFWQIPNTHLNGCGCPSCYGKHALTTEGFIEKAKKIHGDRYIYAKTEYTNSKTEVCITCPKHGDFWQTPSDHLNGHGCPYCGNTMKSDTESFIKKAREIHGSRYGYSKTEYVNNRTKVCIICPEHGEFWQMPSEHLRNHGCPICASISNANKKKNNLEDYYGKFRLAHGGKYDYSKAEYKGYGTKICIVCPEHGEFWQNAYDHATGHGCPKCANQQSKGEEEIISFIKENTDLALECRDKEIISPQELDIYIPGLKLAIEYDGMLWHSEKYGKGNAYHLGKLEKCNSNGIRLIHIFEYEWLQKKEIVKSKLLNILKRNNLQKVFARKCDIKEISSNEAKVFLEMNHIQGFFPSTVYLGAFHDGTLEAAMSFKKCGKDGQWELSRFATDIARHCVGVGSKLFTHFVRNYSPAYVKSFADRRWTLAKDGNLYVKMGFKLEEVLKPDYRYTKGKHDYIHKFNFRKQSLLKKYPDAGLTDSMTEHEMATQLGFYRIYDCGLLKYVWRPA